MLQGIKRKKCAHCNFSLWLFVFCPYLSGFYYKSQYNSKVFRRIFFFAGWHCARSGSQPGVSFVWTLHVVFPPGAPDSSHSPSMCLFNEAMTLNCVRLFVSVCVLARGWTGGPAQRVCCLHSLITGIGSIQPSRQPECRISCASYVVLENENQTNDKCLFIGMTF